MTDPYIAPDGETPTQRRHRLLNLTNTAWQPTSDIADETAPTVADGPEQREGSEADAWQQAPDAVQAAAGGREGEPETAPASTGAAPAKARRSPKGQ